MKKIGNLFYNCEEKLEKYITILTLLMAEVRYLIVVLGFDLVR